jgi:hypothetical protein
MSKKYIYTVYWEFAGRSAVNATEIAVAWKNLQEFKGIVS